MVLMVKPPSSMPAGNSTYCLGSHCPHSPDSTPPATEPECNSDNEIVVPIYKKSPHTGQTVKQARVPASTLTTAKLNRGLYTAPHVLIGLFESDWTGIWQRPQPFSKFCLLGIRPQSE